MYEIQASTKFRRDLKKLIKQQRPIEKLKVIIQLLENGEPLPKKNRDHLLTGNWRQHRECHIEPDWLLIYRINDE